MNFTVIIALTLALQAGMSSTASAAAAGTGSTTNYRVYQNDKALREFNTSKGAIAYAKNFSYAHVEKITGKLWVWDNFPKYKVYENGFSTSSREFRTLQEAKQFAAKLKFAQIRDLEKPGFVAGTYPKYQLYQGDKTLANWSYATLADAKKAAKAYINVHIIDLASNQWIWDNLTVYQKSQQRLGTAKYEIQRDGVSVDTARYAFLLDALRASTRIAGSSVVNVETGLIVHNNLPGFTITQNGTPVKSVYSIDSAVYAAKSLVNAAVTKNGLEWWTNTPYLKVAQGAHFLRSFHTHESAVKYAAQFSDSIVTNADGRAVWNNKRKLLYWGWNGSSRTSTVLSQVSQTHGLDYDSPSWFELAGADGRLSDYSDPALVHAMKQSGIKLTPLVSNQFDAKLTTSFLKNAAARKSFIQNLVGRLKSLGADGVNLDFEMMAGSDRAAYSSFVRSLTNAAHLAGLTVSIDLPRGDVNWDAKTAYDHAELAGIVDMIMIMAYDQHWQNSDEAGSVAELPWVEEGVQQFLDYGIPRSKLMLGVPFYVREWRVNAAGKLVDSKAILMKDIPGLIQEQSALGRFDKASGQIKFTYNKDGYTHVFWAETMDTMKARIAIAKKYELAGVAAWRLGYESSNLWTLLLQQK
ncbi:glycosyl hydrolase family 18 protein [Paenibacillus solisilvae]|uniref:Glycosyl hydrolase family 18 protein n=1 Tax=Paenibacillus solisilvae TaxID=2486751 RepID=A0ABW0VUN4_9BACL